MSQTLYWHIQTTVGHCIVTKGPSTNRFRPPIADLFRDGGRGLAFESAFKKKIRTKPQLVFIKHGPSIKSNRCLFDRGHLFTFCNFNKTRLQRRSLRLPTRSKSAQTGHLCTTAQAGADPVGQNFLVSKWAGGLD